MDSEDDLDRSDVEVDSEVEEDTEAEKELGVWLETLTQFQGENAGAEGATKRQVPLKVALTPKMAMDSFRHSILDFDGSQDVDLDAILGQLCELETQLSTQQSEINDSLRKTSTSEGQEPEGAKQSNHEEDFDAINSQFQSALSELSGIVCASLDQNFNTPDDDGSKLLNGNSKNNMAAIQPQRLSHDPSDADMEVNPAEFARFTRDSTHEPQDGDSAFSDTGSLPSSGSHISVTTTSSQNSGTSGGSSSGAASASPTPNCLPPRLSTAIQDHLDKYTKELQKQNLSPAEQSKKLKAEKIRIALEKIKEANIKKLFVRAYTVDGSSKSILVDESMTVAQVCDMLVVKNHAQPSIHWAVMEQLPDLYMERYLEDHDMVVDVMLLWPRDTSNKLMLVDRPDKFDIFIHPENYLISGTCDPNKVYDEASRKELIQECFQDGNSRIPDIEGFLYLKSEGKKAWKKTFCVLRASGLYYNTKGKSKCSRELQCLQQFEFIELYTGIGWKKKYKAPTDYCFALKHPQIQKKASKFIRYLCADDQQTMQRWVAGIRIAKIGYQLLTNYEDTCERVKNWDPGNILPNPALAQKTAKDSEAYMKSKNGDCDEDKIPEENGQEGAESEQYIPAKMMPNIPVTTDLTKMLSEQYRTLSKPSPKVIPKHGRQKSVSERMVLPPPPPEYNAELPVDQSLPPPPPATALDPTQPDSAHSPVRTVRGISRALSDAQPIRGRHIRRPSEGAAGHHLTRGQSEGERLCEATSQEQSSTMVAVVTGMPQSPMQRRPSTDSNGMTNSYPPPVGSPQLPTAASNVAHRRSGSAPPTPAKPKVIPPPTPPKPPPTSPKPVTSTKPSPPPTAAKPKPPPPPKRSDHTRLTDGQQGEYLSNSFEDTPGSPKKSPLPQPQVENFENAYISSNGDDLPPPPAELLEGLPPRTPKKKPPPPPKRSLSLSRPTSSDA